VRRFEGQTVLVTGASSGIGRATCLRLASEGARIILVARNEERLEKTAHELEGENHLVFSCDLTNDDGVSTMLKSLSKSMGSTKISGVVHCSGIHWLKPLQLTDTASLQMMLNSHVVSSVILIRSLILERLITREGGAVIFVASAAAMRGNPGTLAYAAAKNAQISVAQVLAMELASRKIRVNVIAPGVVQTPLTEAYLSQLTLEQANAIKNAAPLGIGDPEDVAGAAAFLLSKDAKWITGTTLVVDGGLTAH
jgi:NAD(P)-dependent dehydrogenase (short-subunit alcohol dehydrogenase family)